MSAKYIVTPHVIWFKTVFRFSQSFLIISTTFDSDKGSIYKVRIQHPEPIFPF